MGLSKGLNDFIIISLIVIIPFLKGGMTDIAVLGLSGILLLNIMRQPVKKFLYTELQMKNISVMNFYLLILISLSLINFREISDFKRIIQFICCYSVFIYSITRKWDDNTITTIKKIMKFILLLSLVLWGVSNFPKPFNSVYSHFNKFGVICLLAIVFITLPTENRKKSDIFFIGIALIFLYNTSRSSLLGAVFYLLIIILGKKFNNSKTFYKVSFIVLAVFLAWFIIVYPTLYGTEIGHQLELLSREYLHKNFFSGREVIWKNIFESMKGKELMGYGLSMIPEYLYDTSFSSHNLYLQVYLQGGIIGITGLILILYSLFNTMYKGENLKYKPYAAGFIMSLCIHECFEVTLIQNQVDIGMIFWLILGYFINMSRITQDSKSVEKE